MCSRIDFHTVLPIKDSAVCCADGYGMHHLLLERVLRRLSLVHLNSEARAFGFEPIAVSSLKSVLHHVPSPWHVTEHVFLDEEIRCRQVKMKGGCVRDWTERVVRGDTYV